jgi:hypothetical protein
MTAREAACRYSAIDERAAAGFVTALLHHRLGHDHIQSRTRPSRHQSAGDRYGRRGNIEPLYRGPSPFVPQTLPVDRAL